MAHDFEIRFARSAGLAGLLEAPANPARLKGGGRISIDARGIIISARRNLTSLLQRPTTRRIDAANLTEVYREGAALRVEFANEAGTREILPFWARNSKIAADIVRAMPTLRTVEFDQAVSTDESRFEWDKRVLIMLIATIAGIALFALLLWTPSGVAPVTAPPVVMPSAGTEPAPPNFDVERPASETPASAPASDAASAALEPVWQTMPVTIAPPRTPIYVGDEIHVQPIARGSPAYAAARRALEKFEAAAARLRIDYRAQHALFQSTALTNDQFADYLRSSLEMRWWNLTFEILADDALVADGLLDLRATLLACARHWRGFLDGYAEGLLKLDHVAIAEAFDRMSIAEEMESRARRFAPP
jgi:hypothetical protein